MATGGLMCILMLGNHYVYVNNSVIREKYKSYAFHIAFI